MRVCRHADGLPIGCAGFEPGEKGRYKSSTVALLQGQSVKVPNNFNGRFERYQFFMPGVKVVAYDALQPVDFADVDALLETSRYELVARRIGQVPCTNCRIIDSRWDLLSRQEPSEGTLAALKTPDTFLVGQRVPGGAYITLSTSGVLKNGFAIQT